MSLDEKVKTIPPVLKILSRRKTVYVPYSTALKFDFFRPYFESWTRNFEDNPIVIDDYPPELLQSEIDKCTLNVPVLEFLGYGEERKSKEEGTEELLNKFFIKLGKTLNGVLEWHRKYSDHGF